MWGLILFFLLFILLSLNIAFNITHRRREPDVKKIEHIRKQELSKTIKNFCGEDLIINEKDHFRAIHKMAIEKLLEKHG